MRNFFNWFRVLAALNSLQRTQANQEQRMATFQEDIDRLTKDLADQGALIQQVANKEASDATTIADLKTQIDALKGQQNPDLSGLETGINQLEKNNTAMTALLPSPTPPAEPPATPPAA